MIFIFFVACRRNRLQPSLRLTAVVVACPALNLLGVHLFILASLGIAIPGTMPAQATSGEQNPQVVDTPSRADAASLQKKANKPRPGFTPTKTTATS